MSVAAAFASPNEGRKANTTIRMSIVYAPGQPELRLHVLLVPACGSRGAQLSAYAYDLNLALYERTARLLDPHVRMSTPVWPSSHTLGVRSALELGQALLADLQSVVHRVVADYRAAGNP